MILLDGKKISNEIVEELTQEVLFLKKHCVIPKLVIIQVGDVPASNVYINNKTKLSNKLGVITELRKLQKTNDDELITIIKSLNSDCSVNGILVQMPLPEYIDENKIIASIDPNKDVDCFHLINIGKLWTARKKDVRLKPCTPAGIIELLKRYKISIHEKKAVVIGRSNIVGKPMASLLLLDDATVTLCHSKTQNLHQICSNADILISAVGKAKFINSTFIKPGAAIVDVGMNYDVDHKICGDIDFDSVKDIAGFLTPVPGGVGPMTVTMLMKNLIELTKFQHGL